MSFQAVNHPRKATSRTEEDRPGSSSAQSSSVRNNLAKDGTESRANTEKLKPTASASSNSSPKPATSTKSTDQPSDSHNKPTTSDQPQSEPMTATTSQSSHTSTKDGPTPYGTRSRNRPTGSRPNYAEDVEMEFESTAAATNGTAPPITSQDASDTSPDAESQLSNSKNKQPASSSGGWATANKKDSNSPIPGTSTFSANPTTGSSNSKKRKSTGNQNAQATASPAPAAQVTRRSQATNSSDRITNMMFYDKARAILKDGKLEADDGTLLEVNDHVYLVCEPPGEPYYLGRIMEFIHTKSDQPSSPVEALRCNWYYRPRDIGRIQQDSRLVYGTMHSDVCPITSLRGKCRIQHRDDISDFEAYRKEKNSFYFTQVFDRFMHRWFDCIPVSKVINVPEKVKKALDERWKYIVVETSRVKELTSAVKTCKRCGGYCASNDSVECAVCRNTYHMQCVNPPLLKKPSRGFAWACGPCSRAQERKLEARRTPIIGDVPAEDEEEILEEEEEEVANGPSTTAATPHAEDTEMTTGDENQAEIALIKMWPMRYLGIHCRVEDALQYDDRAIYPRASSRLGPRHQANVTAWPGRPVELVKPAEIKKRYANKAGHKKDTKLAKETLAAMEADRADKAKRPKWVQDEPPGYVRRGEDQLKEDKTTTAFSKFRMPTAEALPTRGDDDRPTNYEKLVDDYMIRAKPVAKQIGLKDWSTNFLDKALELFYKHNYDADAALKALKKQDRAKDIKEPVLEKDELKRFEEGVSKYGSELRNVRLHVRTRSHGDIVRFYYMWKKTAKGKEIWGAYEGRKGTKRRVEAESALRLLDDVADDHDDSAFDSNKALNKKRQFQCKFCAKRKSRQWRRAPGVAPGSTTTPDGRTKDRNPVVVALCERCANLWRRYAVEFENIDEVSRKVAAVGGKAWRKRIDQELLNELDAEQEAERNPPPKEIEPSAPVPEQPRKKQKTAAAEKEAAAPKPAPKPAKEKPPPPPRVPTPPPQPSPPKMRDLPCAICQYASPAEDQLVVCKDCRITVHRNCYGVVEPINANAWSCDMCLNDKKETVSYIYECVLCPVTRTEQELVEPPKISHKKKTDREREKERLEKELAVKFAADYRKEQMDRGRPDMPREPLKRTSENNWVHVHCAMFTPETKFSNAKALEMVEGIGPPSIPLSRYQSVCKICKSNKKGACVNCHQCHASFHIGCAHSAGYIFGFDVTPVKSSRRDQVQTVTVGQETGLMAAAIWCKDHVPKTMVHEMNEIIDTETGLNAIQLFVRNYKQADLTLTGTARKATLQDLSAKTITAPAQVANSRRASATGINSRSGRRPSSAGGVKAEEHEPESPIATIAPIERRCITCDIDVTPKWWPLVETASHARYRSLTNGDAVNGTGESKDIVFDRATKWQCHKCHLKKIKARETEDPKPREPTVEYPGRASLAPAPTPVSWMPPNGQPATQPQLTRPPWPPAHTPGNVPPSVPNGVHTSPPQQAAYPAAAHGAYSPHPHHHHAPPPQHHGQPNGYHTSPPHNPAHPAERSPYTATTAPPRANPAPPPIAVGHRASNGTPLRSPSHAPPGQPPSGDPVRRPPPRDPRFEEYPEMRHLPYVPEPLFPWRQRGEREPLIAPQMRPNRDAPPPTAERASSARPTTPREPNQQPRDSRGASQNPDLRHLLH